MAEITVEEKETRTCANMTPFFKPLSKGLYSKVMDLCHRDLYNRKMDH